MRTFYVMLAMGVTGYLGYVIGTVTSPSRIITTPVPYQVRLPCPETAKTLPSPAAASPTAPAPKRPLALPPRPTSMGTRLQQEAVPPATPGDLRVVAPSYSRQAPAEAAKPLEALQQPSKPDPRPVSGVVTLIVTPSPPDCAGQAKHNYGPCPDWMQTTLTLESPGGEASASAAADSGGGSGAGSGGGSGSPGGGAAGCK